MPQILIVDDNRLNIELLRQLLDEHFDLLTAENGELGARAARTHVPDLIIMDLMMPVMDGWAAIAAIRDEWSTCRIPVIAFSAIDDPKGVKRALDAGADVYLPKPVDDDRLFEVIEQLLGVQIFESQASRVRVKRDTLKNMLAQTKKLSEAES